MKLFNKRLKSVEFELVQLRLNMSYQNELWEKIAKKVGVRFPKYDIYKEYTERLNGALSDADMETFALVDEKEKDKDKS